MNVTRMIWHGGTLLMTAAMMAATATAAAQQLASTSHARSATAPKDSTNLKAFRGIAPKLHTTPEALRSAFERARQTNPKLSRGNFIAANVLADNLGARRPNVTTAAILAGLEGGNSLGQTLENLGLSPLESKQARKAAERRVKDGDQRVKDEDKRRQRERENGERHNG